MPALPRWIAAALTALAALGVLVAPAGPAAAVAPRVAAKEPTIRGADVSWPQCPKGLGITGRKGLGLPMPTTAAQFVVLGLTNGPGFTRNPCLTTQVAWVKAHRVHAAAYAVVSYPTAWQLRHFAHRGPYAGDTTPSRLRNVGYAQAVYNIASLRAVGLTVPHVWVDVETYPFRPWTRSVLNNRAVVVGALKAYADAGLTTGIYSTRLQFPAIVGRVTWRLPEWHTAGPRSQATALGRCSEPSFQGGPVVLAQWWTSSADNDLTCPAHTATAFTRFFTPAN
ncbi:MAG: hypothetical protein ACXV2J_08845 [Actinomycetes bacterium]